MDFGSAFYHGFNAMSTSSYLRSPDCSSMNSSTEHQLCTGCSDVITDRYLLVVGNEPWHVTCLRCCICDVTLQTFNSCYVRDENVYCRKHYAREFGKHCSACHEPIQADDWVRFARDNVYHVDCFTCNVCDKHLSTGDEFLLKDDLPLCRMHVTTGAVPKQAEPEKKRRKRIRSTFTEEHLTILQRHFDQETNPDCHDMENLAMMTGHNRRVIQVWFQNARARNKRPAGKKSVAKATKTEQPAQRNWGSGSDSPDSNAMSD